MAALKSIGAGLLGAFTLGASAILLCVLAKSLGANAFQQGVVAASSIFLLPELMGWLVDEKP